MATGDAGQPVENMTATQDPRRLPGMLDDC